MLVGFVIAVFVFVAGVDGLREVGVGVVAEGHVVFEPVGGLLQPAVFVEGPFHGFTVGVGDLRLVVGEVVFVFHDVAVAVFGFGETAELVVGEFARAGGVFHLGSVAIFVVFVLDGMGFAVRVLTSVSWLAGS